MSFNKYFGETETGLSDVLIQALNTIPISAIPYISNLNQFISQGASPTFNNLSLNTVKVSDGDAANPSITFKSDTDTGIYHGTNPNEIATTTNGTVRTIVSDSTTQLNNILECHNDLRIGSGPYVFSSKFDGSGNYMTGNLAIGSTTVGTDALDVTGNIKTTGRIVPGTLNNTLSGVDSGSTITTGEYNILNGFESGKTTISTGSNNILIGKTTGIDGLSSTSNAIAIGENASAGAHGIALGANVLAVAGKTVIGSEANTTATSLYGQVMIKNSTDSVSPTSGAFIVSGGAGIAKSLRVGSTTLSTSTTTGALIVSGGVGIKETLYAKNGYFQNVGESVVEIRNLAGSANNATLRLANDTATKNYTIISAASGTLFVSDETNSVDIMSLNNLKTTFLTTAEAVNLTTGTLVVNGGVSIAKALLVGSTTESASTTTGALIVSGGVGIMKALRIGSTTESSSTTTGAFIVSGGVGIAKNLNVAGAATFPFGIFGGTRNYTAAGSGGTTSVITPLSLGITKPTGISFVTAIAGSPAVYACGIATCTNSTTVNAVIKIGASANSDITLSGGGVVITNNTSTIMNFTVNFTPM